MAQTSASQTAWYFRPTVVALTGVFTAYSLYKLFLASKFLQSSTLHRSNAVHQHRRRQPDPQAHAPVDGIIAMHFQDPSSQAPFGALEISNIDLPHSRMIILRLGLDQMPSMQDLALILHNPAFVYGHILANAMRSALGMCVLLRDRPDEAETPRFDPREFGNLWNAVRSRNERDLRTLESELPILLGLDTNTPSPHEATSRDVVNSFITSEAWQLLPGDEFLVPMDTFPNGNDTLDPAETEGTLGVAANGAPTHDVRGILYYIAEDNATRRAYIHRGIRCEGCGEFPILGIRYHCLNCPDYDLCATCEAHAIHQKNHVFAKIKIPLSLLSQPPTPHKLWYAGDPQKIHDSLNVALRKQLCKDSGFEEAELDALYDQFTCIANVPWYSDPFRVGAAIDRHAFNETMSSDRWTNRFAPNVLLDCMFAFYDTDGNSLIGFKEFVDGMEYLRGSKRFASLQRALQGFDMDGDTYVSRADFVRILRGKFEIQKQLIIDATEGLEAERTQGAMNILRSSQPISSVFNGDDIPPGEERRLDGKLLDANYDIGEGDSILDDEEPFLRRSTRAGPEQLNAALDNFEDLLHGIERADASNSMDGSADLMNSLRVSLAHNSPSTNTEEPYMQDLLWQYTEDGLNALLDPLFSRREEVERRALETRDARYRWRTAIDRYRDNKHHPRDDLLATTPARQRKERLLPRGIVPTDHESLEQLEIETTHAPLERLLELSGYSIRQESDAHTDNVGTAPSQIATMNDEDRSLRTMVSSPLREMSLVDDELGAPRPSSPAMGIELPSTELGEEDEQHPTMETLELWARLDVVDHEIQERGGIGRLSLIEVESIVVEEGLHEVRGLIKSWLEWCAF